jgi:hypothetical protein
VDLDDANARVSILTEANASNLRVMAALSDSLKDANKRIAELEHALCLIYEWEAPLVDDNGVNRSYSYMYGSNGERDYFRNLAFNSLQLPPPAATKEG